LSRDIVENHPEFHSLGESEWCSALPRARDNGRLVYYDPSKLTARADLSVDPFSVTYHRQILDLIEKNLLQEDLPYFQAFVENQRPKELALELGINPKTASRRMKEVRKKLQEILRRLRQPVPSP
jgi:DNA-directed RNA polymerase specialized sigma24 family protein